MSDWNNTTLYDYLECGNYPENWDGFFRLSFVQQELRKISEKLASESDQIIYPPINQVFRALNETSLESIKVCLIGQDPYHNGSAVGLCFSVKPGNTINPSLRNIYKEIGKNGQGDISHWAKQGILMLNTSLTVIDSKPNSHKKLWEKFTDMLLKFIIDNTEHVVWLLWGANAHVYKSFLLNTTHIPFLTTHPSPFSCNKPSTSAPAFIGSNVFAITNEHLSRLGKSEINW